MASNITVTCNSYDSTQRETSVPNSPESFALNVDVRNDSPGNRQEGEQFLAGARFYGNQVHRHHCVFTKTERGVQYVLV